MANSENAQGLTHDRDSARHSSTTSLAALDLRLDDFDLPISVREVDPETGIPGRYLGFNRSFFESYDIADEPSEPRDVVGPTAPEIEAADRTVIDTAETVEITIRRYQQLAALKKLPVLRDGKVVAVLTLSTDITDLATAESQRDLLVLASATTSERMLLYERLDVDRRSAADGQPTHQPVLRLAFINPAGREFLARLEDSTDHLSRQALDELEAVRLEVVASGLAQEARLELDDGFHLVRSQPLTTAEGLVVGIAQTIADITTMIEADWTEQLLDIATQHDLDQALVRALEIGCELLRLPIGVVAQVRDGELVVRGRCNAGALPDRLPVHSDFLSAMRRDHITLSRDVIRQGATGPIVTALGLRSLAAVPIVVDDEPWGLLALGGSEPLDGRFPERSVTLLEALVTTLAHMLERDNARSRLVPIEQLQQSNTELEEYAYAAAHDLRSPLRSMSSFAQLLNQQLATDPTDVEKLRGYAEWVISGANKMDLLLHSMLDHARAMETDDGQPPVEVDLAAMVMEIRDDLIEDVQQTGASITVAPAPKLTCDPSQLKRVLHNLIDNAIKYRHPERPIRIHVDSRRDPDSGVVEIAVIDNGQGIPEEHRERVFGLFKRLQTDDKGTGVGLAVVRRIVENLGGSIAVTDGIDGGTAFVLTIPEHQLHDTESA